MSEKHIIDCTADPMLFGDYNKIVKHKTDMGLWELDVSKLTLYRYGVEPTDYINGKELVALMDAENTPNSCPLDFFVKKPEFIPAEWEDIRRIDFWGTILEDPYGRQVVRRLEFTGLSWAWSYTLLDTNFYSMNSKAVILID